MFCAHSPDRLPSTFRISDLSCHLSTRKMRVRGRSEPLPPSYTRCARSISMSRPLKEGIHLERLARRKTAASGPSIPSGSPTSLTLFRLHRSSISVIFFGESLQLILYIRNCSFIFARRAWTESTRSRVCFVLVTMASKLLS